MTIIQVSKYILFFIIIFIKILNRGGEIPKINFFIIYAFGFSEFPKLLENP
jgi:hypothetical protein